MALRTRESEQRTQTFWVFPEEIEAVLADVVTGNNNGFTSWSTQQTNGGAYRSVKFEGLSNDTIGQLFVAIFIQILPESNDVKAYFRKLLEDGCKFGTFEGTVWMELKAIPVEDDGSGGLIDLDPDLGV